MTEQRRLLGRGQLWRLECEVETLGLVADDLVLVVQNNPYNVNAAYPWCLVAAVGITLGDVPTHVPFEAGDTVIDPVDVGVRAERIGCIPKAWLTEFIGQLNSSTMRRVEQAIGRALALP